VKTSEEPMWDMTLCRQRGRYDNGSERKWKSPDGDLNGNTTGAPSRLPQAVVLSAGDTPAQRSSGNPRSR